MWLVALALCVGFAWISCGAAEVRHDVRFDLSKWGINQVTNRKVLLTPVYLNAPPGTIAPQDTWMFTSDATGGFWVSNMLSGVYHGEVQAPPTRTAFDFFADTTNTTQYAGNNTIASPTPVNFQSYYTAAQTDLAISNALGHGTVAGAITNGQGNVTLGGSFTNSLMTNSYVLSSTSRFGPNVLSFVSNTNAFISQVVWDSHVGGAYVLDHIETSSGGNPVIFLTNGSYGLIYDTQYDDYSHIISITNGHSITIGYLDAIPWPTPQTLVTNGHLALGTFVSLTTNTLIAPGFSGTGPFAFDGSGVSNVVASATNVIGNPAFDGRSITNTLLPANWGAGLMPVPQLGWNSYLQTSCSVNENEVLAVANMWGANGMRDAGWRWLWIDCGWATALTNVNANFPNGLTNVIKICHGLGFKVGIYLGINGLPFGPPTQLGATLNGINAQIFSQMPVIVGWGVDGLKIDGVASVSEVEAHALESRLFSEAVLAGRTNILINLTLHPPGGSELGAGLTPSELFNNIPMWEVTSAQDAGSVNAMLSTADLLRPILWANQPGRCGQLVFAGDINQPINALTNKLNFDVAWPSWLHTGNTNAAATAFFTNQDLVNIVTDGLVAPNREVYSNGLCRIWARPLGNPWPANKYAVLFINGNTTGPANSNLTVSAAMLGWTNNTPIYGRDPYRQLDIGSSNSTWTVNVTTQQTALYVFYRSPLPPTVAFNSLSNHFATAQFVNGKIYGTGMYIDFNTKQIANPSGDAIIDLSSKSARDDNGNGSVNWSVYNLNDSAGLSVDWHSRILYDESTTPSADWHSRILYDSGNMVSIDWQNRVLIDSNTQTAIDYFNRYLYDSTGVPCFDWGNRTLLGDTGTGCLRWHDNNIFDYTDTYKYLHEGNTLAANKIVGVISNNVGFVSSISNGTKAASITLSASPSLWTNTSGVNVKFYFAGGSVSGVGLNGGTLPVPNAGAQIDLKPGEWVGITNSSIPSAAWRPW